ncbi:MAG: hypothetical protein WCI55_08115 [Armatimonadota bacterium]
MKQTLHERMDGLDGGMNSGVDPLKIKRNQCLYASNATFRGDFFKTRPNFKYIPLKGDTTDLSSAFNGQFQGACFYAPKSVDTSVNANNLSIQGTPIPNSGGSIVMAMGGGVYMITPDEPYLNPATNKITKSSAATVTKISVPLNNANTADNNGRNQSSSGQSWLWQSEDWCIINDGINNPVFIGPAPNFSTSGTSQSSALTATRSLGVQNTPVSFVASAGSAGVSVSPQGQDMPLGMKNQLPSTYSMGTLFQIGKSGIFQFKSQTSGSTSPGYTKASFTKPVNRQLLVTTPDSINPGTTLTQNNQYLGYITGITYDPGYTPPTAGNWPLPTATSSPDLATITLNYTSIHNSLSQQTGVSSTPFLPPSGDIYESQYVWVGLYPFNHQEYRSVLTKNNIVGNNGIIIYVGDTFVIGGVQCTVTYVDSQKIQVCPTALAGNSTYYGQAILASNSISVGSKTNAALVKHNGGGSGTYGSYVDSNGTNMAWDYTNSYSGTVVLTPAISGQTWINPQSVNYPFTVSTSNVIPSSADQHVFQVGKIPVASLTQTGGTATVTTAFPHGLTGTPTISITGANQTAYNVSKVIATVSTGSTTKLTFSIASSTVSPATVATSSSSIFVLLPTFASFKGTANGSSSITKCSLISGSGAVPIVSSPSSLSYSNYGSILFDGSVSAGKVINGPSYTTSSSTNTPNTSAVFDGSKQIELYVGSLATNGFYNVQTFNVRTGTIKVSWAGNVGSVTGSATQFSTEVQIGDLISLPAVAATLTTAAIPVQNIGYVTAISSVTTMTLSPYQTTPQSVTSASQAYVSGYSALTYVYSLTTATVATGTQYSALFTNINATGTLYDGDSITPVSQLPAGRMGVYSLGRNWMATSDGRGFIASDIVGGATSTASFNKKDGVIYTSENQLLAGGGSFTVPGNSGVIRAMLFSAALDVSLGQGPIQVLTDRSIFSCNAPTDRTTWQSTTNPIVSTSLIGSGGAGQYAIAQSNGDILFKASDGSIRSLLLARLDFNRWGNTPISREMDRVLSQEDNTLCKYASAVVFDNRFLLTSIPSNSTRGVYWKSIIALNFDPHSTLSEKKPSIYDGEWLKYDGSSGLNVLQIVSGFFSGIERCFLICLSSDLKTIQLYELLLSNESTQDYMDDAILHDVTSSLETKELMFGDDEETGPHLYKRLVYGELFVDKITTSIKFDTYYEPDQYPNWVPWSSFTLPYDYVLNPGFNPRIGLPEPDSSSCDTSNNRPLKEGYSFQLKIVMTGSCRYLGGRFTSDIIPQPEFAKPICDTPIYGAAPLPTFTPSIFCGLNPVPNSAVYPASTSSSALYYGDSSSISLWFWSAVQRQWVGLKTPSNPIALPSTYGSATFFTQGFQVMIGTYATPPATVTIIQAATSGNPFPVTATVLFAPPIPTQPCIYYQDQPAGSGFSNGASPSVATNVYLWSPSGKTWYAAISGTTSNTTIGASLSSNANIIVSTTSSPTVLKQTIQNAPGIYIYDNPTPSLFLWSVNNSKWFKAI